MKLRFFRVLRNDHSPNAVEEVADAADAVHIPRLDRFERAHKHFVQAKRVGAVLRDDVVRVDDVSAALRHLFRFADNDDRRIGREDVIVAALRDVFLRQFDRLKFGTVRFKRRGVRRFVDVDFARRNPSAVRVLESGIFHFAENHSLVDEALERLFRRDVTEVVQDFMPKTRVKQVQDGVFRAPDVKVDRAPSLFDFRVDDRVGVFRVEVAQVVPAGAGPLRHRVRFALVFFAVALDVKPIGGSVFERRFGTAFLRVEDEVRRNVERKFFRFERANDAVRLAVFAEFAEERERFAPEVLTAEEPVAELVIDRFTSQTGRV